MSAVGWNEYEISEGDPLTRLKYGYARLIDTFLSKIPPHCLMLGRKCERISWTNNPGHCEIDVLNRQTGQRELLVCDFVVTTSSLGYLKANHHTMFNPQLPLNKIKAIENLGFGCVNKIFVVFDHALVSPNDKSDMIEGFYILWRADMNLNIDNADKKYNLQVLSIFV